MVSTATNIDFNDRRQNELVFGWGCSWSLWWHIRAAGFIALPSDETFAGTLTTLAWLGRLSFIVRISDKVTSSVVHLVDRMKFKPRSRLAVLQSKN